MDDGSVGTPDGADASTRSWPISWPTCRGCSPRSENRTARSPSCSTGSCRPSPTGERCGCVNRTAASAGSRRRTGIRRVPTSSRSCGRPSRSPRRTAPRSTELFSGGGAQVYEGLGEDLIDLVAATEETRTVWKRLGLESLAVVPLLAGGVASGSIMLVIADDRRFDREGLRMVEGMALQCALLVEKHAARPREGAGHPGARPAG